MGMILGLVSAPDEQLQRVIADPPLVWRLLAPDDPEAYALARAEADRPSFLGRIFGKKPASGGGGPTLDVEGSIHTDLDKAWHGIHYLLTGTAWDGSAPLDFLVAGGRVLSRIDAGYGPPRVFLASETLGIHRALGDLSDSVLRDRFRPAEMMKLEIYPEIWDRPPEEDDTSGYLMEYLGVLRGFLSQATGEKQGMVVYLS
jgi:hypothetical protein